MIFQFLELHKVKNELSFSVVFIELLRYKHELNNYTDTKAFVGFFAGKFSGINMPS
jgi:hypothetical protein